MVADPQDLLVALRHPLRREILKLLLESGGKALSPSELSRILLESLSNVSYHCRVLLASGAIELEETEPKSGSLRHLYRPTATVERTPWVRETLGLPRGHEE